MRFARRRLAALLILILVAFAVQLQEPRSAVGSSCASDFGPDDGVVQASGPFGSFYHSSLEFVLTQAQIDNLRCLGPLLEIDFHLEGFNLPPQWEDYTIFSNLPGAMHDVALSDVFEQVPAVTGVQTARLEAGKRYYAGISWNKPNASSPKVWIGWAASTFPRTPNEFQLCGMADLLNWENKLAYCIFGNTSFNLSKDRLGGDGRINFQHTNGAHPFGNWPITSSEVLGYGTGSTTPRDATIGFKAAYQAPAPPPNNTLLRTLHRVEGDANVVYWAKEGSVFETWWQPGKTSPKHEEIIRIAQNNIVDIAQHTKPDGTHLLYTATKSGIWESKWVVNGPISHALLIPNADYDGTVRKIEKTIQPDGTEQLYVMTDKGVDEYWWVPYGEIHRTRLFTLNNPVAMKKFTAPDGKQMVFTADNAYVYKTEWLPGWSGPQTSQVIHISQGGIRDIDFSRDADGKHRLFTAEATGMWESTWYEGGGVGHVKRLHDTDIRQIQAYGMNVYVMTSSAIVEYWRTSPDAGFNGFVLAGGQNNLRDLQRSVSADGAQTVYIAADTQVKDVFWWPGGDGVRVGLVA